MVACSGEEPQFYIDEGIALYEKGDLESARVQFQTAIQLNPKAAEAYFRLAGIAEKKGNWRNMQAYLLDAVTSDPKLLDARLKLGQLYLLSGEHEKAAVQVDAILVLDPNNETGQLMRATVYLRQQESAEALQIIERTLAQHPFLPEAIALKVAYFSDEGNDDQAQTLLDEAIEHNPNNNELRLLKIRLASEQDQVDQVTGQYEILLQQNPEEVAFRLGLANYLLNLGQSERAETLLREAIVLQSERNELKLKLINLVAKRDPSQVEVLLQEAIAASPNAMPLHFRLVEHYLTGNQLDAAEAILKQILSLSNETIDQVNAYVKLAQIALLKKDEVAVERLVDKVLAIDASQSDALLLRADMRLNRNDVDGAVADLRIVLGNRPDLEPALLLMARASFAKGEREVAESHWHKVLRNNPGNLSAVLPLAKSLAKRGDYERAEKLVKQARQQYPVLIGLLELQLQLKIKQQDWAGAEQLIAELAQAQEGKVAAQYWQGMVTLEKGKTEQAIRIFQQLLVQNPNNTEVLNTLVKMMRKAGQSKKLGQYLDTLIAQHPDIDVLYYTLALIYSSDQNWLAAEKILRQKLLLTEQDSQAYRLLARIYQNQGKTNAAEIVFKLGIQKTHEEPMLMAELAKFYVIGKNYDQAIAMYDQIVGRYPDNAEAINNLGDLLVTHRSEDPASIQRARDMMAPFHDSTVAPILDTCGWVLVQSGDEQQAVPILKKAVAGLAQDARVYYHLGEALYRANEYTEAIAVLKQALELAQKYGEFVEIGKARALYAQLQANPDDG